jgi:uncharacterized damage-inducible protein DinB
VTLLSTSLSVGGDRLLLVADSNDLTDADLRGSRFSHVDLSGAVFRSSTLEGARFEEVDLTGVRVRGACLRDVDLDGELDGFVVNGVEVGPFVEAELERRYPERAALRRGDADGFRESWAISERAWEATVARARRLPEELLHERVDGEWSFVQTLRHLVFCTDAWLLRAVLGQPSPYSPLGLPHDEMPDLPGVPRDYELRPSLDEVLAVRADRAATVREVLAGLTDERLEEHTEPVPEPGYPESESFPVRRCLRAVVGEESLHRQFAERDLAVLEQR